MTERRKYALAVAAILAATLAYYAVARRAARRAKPAPITDEGRTPRVP